MKKTLNEYVKQLRSDRELQIRGYTIAKHYYALGEYAMAKDALHSFHKREQNAESYKLLGLCEQRLMQGNSSVQSYQKSLMLNEKQPELIVEICKLLLEEQNFDFHKAQYWCGVGESEKLRDEAVVLLRHKLLENAGIESIKQQSCILKEFGKQKHHTVEYQIKFVKELLDQNERMKALFKIFDIEMGENEDLKNDDKWVEVVLDVLRVYEESKQLRPINNWPYWLLKITYLERSLCMAFKNENLTNASAILFELDQNLFKIDKMAEYLRKPSSLAVIFYQHFTGQFLLHAATLLIKRELLQQNPQWKYVLTIILPLLLISYQTASFKTKRSWLNKCNGPIKLLVHTWLRAGSFRCLQIASVLRLCVAANGMQQGGLAFWSTKNDLICQIKQTYSNIKWRSNLFALLFFKQTNLNRIKYSMLAMGNTFPEPQYRLPGIVEVEAHAHLAQFYKPHSLEHMLCVGLSHDNLFEMKAKYFSGLSFSTEVLDCCDVTRLNKLDIDSFLYATCIEFKSNMQHENGNIFFPIFTCLPKPLFKKEQENWWSTAFRFYQKRNYHEVTSTELANLKTGIEAVRGVNGPKADLMLVLKLAATIVKRSKMTTKLVEKKLLEARAENLYKCALNMFKMHYINILEPFGKYFAYFTNNELDLQLALVEAISYLAAWRFEKPEYAELIKDMNDINTPLATCVKAIAIYKLNCADRLCKVKSGGYLRRLYKCYVRALTYLDDIDPRNNHPLYLYLKNERNKFKEAYNEILDEFYTNKNQT